MWGYGYRVRVRVRVRIMGIVWMAGRGIEKDVFYEATNSVVRKCMPDNPNPNPTPNPYSVVSRCMLNLSEGLHAHA